MLSVKQKALVGIIGLSLLSGCARYQAIQPYQQEISNVSKEVILSSIIAAADRSGWKICEKGPDQLRLSLKYKRWIITADATYSQNGYRYVIDPVLTTLQNEDGEVHRNANGVVKKLDKRTMQYLQLFMKEGPNIKKLNKCENLASVGTVVKGIMPGLRYVVDTSFVWTGKEQQIPTSTPMTFEVTAGEYVPQALKDSMKIRVHDFLLKNQRIDVKGKKAYHLEVFLKNFKEHSNGAVEDYVLGTGNQRLEVVATVKDYDGKNVCQVFASTTINTGGLAFIYKSSNTITAALAEEIERVLNQKLYR